jgi:hypothetical protein
MAGCWVSVPAATTHVAVGLVGNVTVQLQQGWNLVSLPHVSQISYAQAVAEMGASCQAVEGFDLSATYRMKVLGTGDTLSPGYAYWIYMTSAAPWVVNNY